MANDDSGTGQPAAIVRNELIISMRRDVHMEPDMSIAYQNMKMERHPLSSDYCYSNQSM